MLSYRPPPKKEGKDFCGTSEKKRYKKNECQLRYMPPYLHSQFLCKNENVEVQKIVNVAPDRRYLEKQENK